MELRVLRLTVSPNTVVMIVIRTEEVCNCEIEYQAAVRQYTVINNIKSYSRFVKVPSQMPW